MNGLKECDNEYAEHFYYMPSGSERENGFWPMQAGRMVAKPNYQMSMRSSPLYSVHFILEGHAVLEFAGQRAILSEEDIFCRFPSEDLQCSVVPSNPSLRMAWISFNGTGASSLLQHTGLYPHRPFIRKAVPTHFPNLLQQVLLEFRHLQDNRNYLRFISMLYDLFGQLNTAGSAREEREIKHISWLQQSVEFMERRFSEGITVQEVADHVGINRSNFSTSFTEQCGITPMHYLQKLRMDSARKMLRDTAFLVTEIAVSLGYSDLHAFTRSFRKYYGVSPSEFRNQEAVL